MRPSALPAMHRVFKFAVWALLPLSLAPVQAYAVSDNSGPGQQRERISINKDWRFWRSRDNPDGIVYEWNWDLGNLTNPTILSPWILPSANDFIKDPNNHYARPSEDPAIDVPYVKATFDDSQWQQLTLPHDWAIGGPYLPLDDKKINGYMGHLPSNGIGWYRRNIALGEQDKGKSIYLDVDGALAFAMVWLNGKLVGGWPYGYNSFRLDLTPFVKIGGDNILAIRIDHPVKSSRWYPGGGIYRNVWLTKTNPVHVAQWGTSVTFKDVSAQSATVDLEVQVENRGDKTSKVDVVTTIYQYDRATKKAGRKITAFPAKSVEVKAGEKGSTAASVQVSNPKLWGPTPQYTPNLYIATTRVSVDGQQVDAYDTKFGIRSLEYTGNGLKINGNLVRIQGVNMHHDLGALGAAFNTRAAERQIEILQSIGVNGIRTAHTPPAPELLDLADEMGVLIENEIFDAWATKKNDYDFHIIFDKWHEADLRAFMRRDRNHASVIAWNIGNEVREQLQKEEGAAVGQMLVDIAHDQDPTRPLTASVTISNPDTPFPKLWDIISLNYIGEGVGAQLPAFPDFHNFFPNKTLSSSESGSHFSSRGVYYFPVVKEDSGAFAADGVGGNSTEMQVSGYGLYTASYGTTPDKVLAAHDNLTYTAGHFVWSGFDYIGEPTPYLNARSSYSGIIDLAGFRKDWAYLYQSKWLPDKPMAHILPHWNWAGREGQVTPVHVFTSGDEAELFINGESKGRKKKSRLQYRLRWDDVTYQPGDVHVVAYKDGKEWAQDTVKTAGQAAALRITADRDAIAANGVDLSFLTVEVVDKDGNPVRNANNKVTFASCGAGKIVGTDNGDATDYVVFPSLERKAFAGKALAIVQSREGRAGSRVKIRASAEGLESARITINVV